MAIWTKNGKITQRGAYPFTGKRLGVNGGEKPWRLAGSGGRLNRAAPKCSVVDFVSRRKAVIMAGFWVKDLEGDK